MEQKSMTALVGAFARAYHAQAEGIKVFDDSLARALLSEKEYDQIAESMSAGIGFFSPGFTGGREEALRRIVDRHLAPAPLGRAAFAEQSLKNAVRTGAGQYLIFAAGYDTFAYRQPFWAKKLEVFEIDHPITAADKQARLKRAGIETPPNTHAVPADLGREGWKEALLREPAFSRDRISFCSLLGLTYYLTAREFQSLLHTAAGFLAQGSALAFDYPDEDYGRREGGEKSRKQTELARGAGEEMRARYRYREMESLLADNGFLIYEHLSPGEMTEEYFKAYNRQNPLREMAAFPHVNHCLAVKG